MIYRIDEVENFYNRLIELQNEGADKEQITNWFKILVSQYQSRIEKGILEAAKDDVINLFDVIIDEM